MDPNKGQSNQQSAGEQPDLLSEVGNKFSAHKAAPGPAMIPQGINVPEEGTKEERRAKAAEWNQERDGSAEGMGKKGP